ncbi:hypothetical protein DL93DRAFT_2103821, partial [Clavulina sp. PMI_390]
MKRCRQWQMMIGPGRNDIWGIAHCVVQCRPSGSTAGCLREVAVCLANHILYGICGRYYTGIQCIVASGIAHVRSGRQSGAKSVACCKNGARAGGGATWQDARAKIKFASKRGASERPAVGPIAIEVPRATAFHGGSLAVDNVFSSPFVHLSDLL